MQFEKPVIQSWRKVRIPYRLQHDPYHLVFVIESFDRLPEEPRLWIEGNDVVIHHSANFFLVLPNMPPDLLEEIAQRDTVSISEQHQRHHNDAILPWGMDKVGGSGRLYVVPVIHTEKIGDIREIFNSLPEFNPENDANTP